MHPIGVLALVCGVAIWFLMIIASMSVVSYEKSYAEHEHMQKTVNSFRKSVHRKALKINRLSAELQSVTTKWRNAKHDVTNLKRRAR